MSLGPAECGTKIPTESDLPVVEKSDFAHGFMEGSGGYELRKLDFNDNYLTRDSTYISHG